MSVCHYMRVWLPGGGIGGSRLVMPSARSTAAARGVPGVTERGAEIDIDDADGFEGRLSFGGGEVEGRGLELFFDRAMEQEGKRGDEYVGRDARVGAMIDRPQVDHVLEIGEDARPR